MSLASCSKNPDRSLQDARVTGILTSQFKELAARKEPEVSKIQEITNDLSELSRDDLKFLVYRASQLLKGMRKLRIKRLFKRCGKPGCTCTQGELTDYGHGPYLYAIWSENGKRRQKSLGRIYHEWEFKRMAGTELPVWFEKRFLVSEKEYLAKTLEGRWSCKERSLDDAEFLAFYNILPDEDKVGRPRRLRYHQDKFDAAVSEALDQQTRGENEFQHYGIGTLRGVLHLRSMLAKGFYLVETADGENDA